MIKILESPRWRKEDALADDRVPDEERIRRGSKEVFSRRVEKSWAFKRIGEIDWVQKQLGSKLEEIGGGFGKVELGTAA
jgi:hypothetical protein